MDKFLELINEMSPYLLLGFLIAGFMHAFIPSTIYSKYLSRANFKSVLLAALFGVPIPLCSCGVIPTAMSLRREGASKGAATSFLIATPQTGVDSIIATFSLMGLPFAIIRPIAALITAVFGGQLVNWVEGKDGEGTVTGKGEVVAQCDCDDCCADEHNHDHSLKGKIKEALSYAYIEMMEDIGKWLVVGLIVAGLITLFVPDSFFEIFKDNSLASMLLVLCIAIPMYLCATGSIPIAVALMMKGLTPGAGLVLLMAGPACNFASMLVINKVMGRRTLITYLASIIAGAVGFGLIIDHLLPRAWFISSLVANDACCEEHQSWFSVGCTILLCLLLANAILRKKFSHHSHKGHDHCSCGHDHSNNNEEKMVFIIEGMNCNHCRLSAEKAILSVEGVKNATVDLNSKTAVVEGDASFEDIAKAIEGVGFKPLTPALPPFRQA